MTKNFIGRKIEVQDQYTLLFLIYFFFLSSLLFNYRNSNVNCLRNRAHARCVAPVLFFIPFSNWKKEILIFLLLHVTLYLFIFGEFTFFCIYHFTDHFTFIPAVNRMNFSVIICKWIFSFIEIGILHFWHTRMTQ